MKKLVVSETFYSLQCEGPHTGYPAVFLRLAGCNLLCKSATWICDTIEVWQKGFPMMNEEVLSEEFIDHLKAGAHLVITGGEPLKQQDGLEEFLQWLRIRKNCKPFIEVETNGTIVPNPYLFNNVKSWNVSPKLANSGEPYNRRVNEMALDRLNNNPHSFFKFVVSEPEDALEIASDYGSMIDFKKTILMPAGATRAELEVTRPVVVEMAKSMGIRYSDRLHIVIWDKKTGV